MADRIRQAIRQFSEVSAVTPENESVPSLGEACEGDVPGGHYVEDGRVRVAMRSDSALHPKIIQDGGRSIRDGRDEFKQAT